MKSHRGNPMIRVVKSSLYIYNYQYRQQVIALSKFCVDKRHHIYYLGNHRHFRHHKHHGHNGHHWHPAVWRLPYLCGSSWYNVIISRFFHTSWAASPTDFETVFGLTLWHIHSSKSCSSCFAFSPNASCSVANSTIQKDISIWISERIWHHIGIGVRAHHMYEKNRARKFHCNIPQFN